MISNQIPIMQNLTQPQKRVLFGLYQKIEELFKFKKKLRKYQSEINGKILINKQIIEQSKLRNDENNLYYKDRISELQDNVNKKVSLVKQFQKKFSEVEIFVQRECKNPEHYDKWGHWQTFTIVPFMDKNESLLKLKYHFEILIEKRAKKACDLVDENKNIQMEKHVNYCLFTNEKNHSFDYNNFIINLENEVSIKEEFKEMLEMLTERITKKNFYKCPKEIIPSMNKKNVHDERLETLSFNLNEHKNDENENVEFEDNQIHEDGNQFYNDIDEIKPNWII